MDSEQLILVEVDAVVELVEYDILKEEEGEAEQFGCLQENNKQLDVPLGVACQRLEIVQLREAGVRCSTGRPRWAPVGTGSPAKS